MTFWLNGKLREPSNLEATVSAQSAGLTLGWGVFTTLAVRNGAPRFLERHFARLQRDAALAEVSLEADFALISTAVQAVLSANNLENGLVRLTASRRDDGRWNTHTGTDLSVFAIETLRDSRPDPWLRAQLSPFRTEARRPLVGVKTTSYLPYLWAWREAKAQGFDEAILRESHNFWCDGARSTLFWLQSDEIFTPSLQTGCLRGIGRDLALEWARTRGIIVHQGQFSDAEAIDSDELWLVSASTGPRAVKALHDESGALTKEFHSVTDFCSDFSRWFEAESR